MKNPQSHAVPIPVHLPLKRRLIAATIVLALIAAPSFCIARQYRQEKLNRELIAAIKRSEADRVDTLLAEGANPNTRDTPKKPNSIWELLHDLMHPPMYDSSLTALAVAVSKQSENDRRRPHTTAKIARSLLTKGANVNAVRDNDCDPLSTYFAVRCICSKRLPDSNEDGDTEVLEILLSAGANVGKGFDNNTPLMLALEYNLTDSIRLLLNYHADPNQVDSSGIRPMMYAVDNGYMSAVSLMLDHGANLDVADRWGTPLKHARMMHNVAIVHLLLAHCAKE